VGEVAEARAAALHALGARGGVLAELLAYGESPLLTAPLAPAPLPAEPCVPTWAAWAAEAARTGDGAACLQRHLVQLRFPVAAGVSATPAYQAATRRGDEGACPPPEAWPRFADGAGVRLLVHATPAGPLPVVVARARADFEYLVRALAHRAEPAPVPGAKGACMIAGFNNWARVAEERRRWAAARGADDDAAWRAAFAALVPQRDRYQDRFVVLSEGPYSAVPAAELGLGDAEWRARSLRVRLEHECAHYATKRLFGSMRNALHDELLADYLGLTAPADGRGPRLPYRAGWALRCLGVDRAGPPRPDGRLANYRGDPPLSDGAFTLLAAVARGAVAAVAAWDRARPRRGDAAADGLEALVALARTPVECLAAPGGAARLTAAHAAVRAAGPRPSFLARFPARAPDGAPCIPAAGPARAALTAAHPGVEP
jgi:hypothetical protein